MVNFSINYILFQTKKLFLCHKPSHSGQCGMKDFLVDGGHHAELDIIVPTIILIPIKDSGAPSKFNQQKCKNLSVVWFVGSAMSSASLFFCFDALSGSSSAVFVSSADEGSSTS